ncbi:hypothetical protein C6558_31895 [Ensifer sp. NM-2]|nr:hypothetical protein C6558_31895 [Ensifer sp. NM-2]
MLQIQRPRLICNAWHDLLAEGLSWVVHRIERAEGEAEVALAAKRWRRAPGHHADVLDRQFEAGADFTYI